MFAYLSKAARVDRLETNTFSMETIGVSAMNCTFLQTSYLLCCPHLLLEVLSVLYYEWFEYTNPLAVVIC